MSRNRYVGQDCPIADALNEIGDWWTLLVVRELIYGVSRFEDFQEHLGVARNILADRLKRLRAAGIVERRADPDDKRSFRYVLTKKGRSLWTVIAALVLWSNRWVAAPGKALVEIRDGASGKTVTDLIPASGDGALVDIRLAELVAGPAASEKTRRRLALRSAKAKAAAIENAQRGRQAPKRKRYKTAS